MTPGDLLTLVQADVLTPTLWDSVTSDGVRVFPGEQLILLEGPSKRLSRFLIRVLTMHGPGWIVTESAKLVT